MARRVLRECCYCFPQRHEGHKENVTTISHKGARGTILVEASDN